VPPAVAVRIREQVYEYLIEPRRIGRHPDVLGKSQLDRPPGRRRSILERPPRRPREMNRLERDPEPPSLDLRQVKQVIDEIGEPAPLSLDPADALVDLFLRQFVTARRQGGGESRDHRDRRPQLVGYKPKELALGLSAHP